MSWKQLSERKRKAKERSMVRLSTGISEKVYPEKHNKFWTKNHNSKEKPNQATFLAAAVSTATRREPITLPKLKFLGD